MAQFGSRTSVTSQNLSAVADAQGNLIISPDNSFGASPLGVAARTQALYGIPNANFNLLPNDPLAAVATGNELPYWQIVNTGSITATMNYDDTNQTWAVRLDPSAAASGDSLSLTTRSYLLNDTNLSLRQKAFAAITKVGTMATSQWNLVASATYYDHAGSALSTYNIGTANSGSAWTTINGFTTSGTAIISASAQYVDLALTLTASTAVTGTAKVDLTSVLLQTSTGGGASQSFLVTQSFTSSGTFTVPTGVNYVTVVALSPGGGGRGGRSYATNATTATTLAGGQGIGGGATGYWAMRRDIYVGNVATVSVGIGAGGTGGTATTITKAAAGTASPLGSNAAGGVAPGDAGATTFGTLLTVTGPVSSATGAVPTGFYGLDQVAGLPNSSSGAPGTAHPISTTYTAAPFTTFINTSTAGANGSGSGGTGTAANGGGTATGTAIAGSGGATFSGTASSSSSVTNSAAAGPGGGGGGGGSSMRYISGASQTIVATGGAGGNAVANSGGGGGGGGDALVAASSVANYNSAIITATSGKGGDGATGFLVVAYIA